MNREIKFRAWDNHYKYMNYKILVGIYGDWEKVKDDKNYTSCSMWIEPKNVDYKCEPHWSNFEPYHKDIKLMQYTGLKDKNGVEIYEGDIVKDAWGILMVVKYINTGFYLCRKNINGQYTKVSNWRNLNTKEVIGNIFENGHLLKESEE